MANDNNFKIKNGLQAGRYLQTGGTETAGSVGYNLAGAEYDSVSFSVAGQEASPYGIFFKPDGTKMYIVGYTGDDVNEYDLSTAWDVSTASYLQVFSVSAQDTTPLKLFFKPDGTKMFVLGATGDDVNEYDLSTAWDIATASYLQNFSVAAQDTSPGNVFFKPDGTKMYIVGVAGQDVNEYNLSTAWDISTSVYSQNFSVAAQDTSPIDLFFKPDGTKMYVLGASNDTVYQYSTVDYTQTLDLSTGSYFSFTPSGATTVSFTNAPASGKAVGFAVEINGDGSVITWPTSVKWPSGTAPTATASKEVYAFVTTDGGTTYYGKKVD